MTIDTTNMCSHLQKKLFEEGVTYILSKDIYKHRRASKEDADVWLAKGGIWSDDTISVWALGSTDSGVSWIVETEGKRIFHAGDLNNWYAKFLTDDNPDHHHAEDRAKGESHQGHRGLVSRCH